MKTFGVIIVIPLDKIYTNYSLDSTIDEVFKLNPVPIYFNSSKWFQFVGIVGDFCRDCLFLKFTSKIPIFEEIVEAMEYPKYYHKEARVKFPFLFVDTNPLLYIKFSRYSSVGRAGSL